ncbi:MAG: lysylphosphatidylglycerol synthase transmembrane domain-containing protein [Gemmatimonadota bacterium]|nr:lysylphosphatidylglycerol synthase transmembrane domain-containing protein [Gemmatimonadota bacterium]
MASGLVVLAAVVVVVVRRDEGIKFADLVKRAQPGWLLLVLVLQAGTYVCAAGVWQRVLARQGIHNSIWQLIPLGLAKLFMDQVVPSAGLGGTMLVVRALKRRGVPEGASVSAVVVGMVSFHVAYGVALVVALALLGISGHLSGRMLWLAVLSTLFLGGMIGLLLWLSWGKEGGRVRVWLMRIPGLKGFMQMQLGVFLLDTATLAACLASLGTTASFSGLFAGFVIASLVATITLIPSGLGTFDATLFAMLRLMGVPATAGLGAILLFRGFTLMLPLIPGLWLARREMKAV